jgi:hypothetical protein
MVVPRWVTKMGLPRSTCDVVPCDVTANLNIFTGKIKHAFFSDGYPQDTTLRSRISSSEWKLIDTEFCQVWSNTRASKTNCLVKVLLLVPGAYLFYWGPVMLDKLDTERQLAVHECIAKLNKYVMIPRGLYMKMFETSVGGYGGGTHGPTLYYWIQIATTLQAARDLKQTLNYDPSTLEVRLPTCCGCDPNKDVPTEETIGEDSQFQSRWPDWPLEIPDATINSSRQEVWDLVARM